MSGTTSRRNLYVSVYDTKLIQSVQRAGARNVACKGLKERLRMNAFSNSALQCLSRKTLKDALDPSA